MQNLKEEWLKILDLLETEVTALSFDLWIKTLEVIDVKDEILYITATSEIAKQRCKENYSNELKRAIAEVMPQVEGFEILTVEETKDFLQNAKKNDVVEITESKAKTSSKFNPKFTFESFVVGKSNQFVYAAARSIAENPCYKYNPLFIYGGVGLGKTHLMHAIGNYLRIHNKDLQVLYVTCEQFTNDYIDSLRNNNKDRSIMEFRNKYRNVDVLIIDDIQFIANKLETQEEFFHTFNDLYQNNKQIIIASDRSPKDIATLSDRLKSRFASGLIQDIQSPDFETRVAILKKKAQEENFNVDDDVINYLAENINTNIRELEGYLSKVCFYANLKGKHFASMVDCEEAMKDTLLQEKESLSVEIIIDTVCKYYNVEKRDLLGKKKNKEFVDPRQVCAYLICDLMDLPLASIGSALGGRDHTTVIHARDKISEGIKNNNKLRVIVSDLKSMILKK